MPGYMKGRAMRIEFKKKAAKYIEALDRPTKQRIRSAILGLLATPPQGDIKLLQGTNDESLRLRVGGYRVIYRMERDTIIIDKVDSRGDVYK